MGFWPVFLLFVTFYQLHLVRAQNDQNCMCGKANINEDEPLLTSKIFGGKPVNPPHKYPWMALISIPYNQCGGTVISQEHILTGK